MAATTYKAEQVRHALKRLRESIDNRADRAASLQLAADAIAVGALRRTVNAMLRHGPLGPTWTAESVKRELPMVRLRIAKGKIVDARVSGRLNQSATVSVTNDKPQRRLAAVHGLAFFVGSVGPQSQQRRTAQHLRNL